MQQLEGRVAVVTGAASGIGRALSTRLAEAGMRVVLADLEAGALRQAAADLDARGFPVLDVPTDVTRPDALHALAERTLEAFGAAHVLCNNAGVFAGGTSWEAPLSDYEWVFSVNVMGVVHGLRAFMPLLLAQDEAHVVNTASMAGLTSAPFIAPYAMSKHAVLSLSETLYLEMRARESRVGVSVVCPELVHTRIAESDRNRPEHLKRDAAGHAEQELVESAIRASMSSGVAPEVIADRALQAIREERLYVLAPEGDPWRVACNARLDDLRAARNPEGMVPGVD
jgi:NAD(P)-dependent dehydrogenase (short-subunit alcohol dehydrogenase family)